MKILACTDMHVPEGLYENLMALKKKHKPEILICCGDISIFGQGQKEILDILKKIKLPTFMVHGNHDDYDLFDAYCRKVTYFHNVHQTFYEFGPYVFFGWGGGGFSFKQPSFEKWSKTIIKELRIRGKRGVFLTHQPVFGTNMDIVWGDTHVGSKSFRSFVKKQSKDIALVLSGHIHEGFKCIDKIGATAIMNPGDDGIVIDIE